MEAAAERNAEDPIEFVRSLLAAPTTGTAKVLAVAMLLLPLAYTDAVLIPAWTPRMAVALLVLPIGIAHFGTHLRQLDRPALWTSGIMVACTLGTLIGDAPLWNIRGGYGRDSSLTFLLVLAAFWAAARSIDHAGRRLVVAASIVGVGISCLVAIAQVIATPSRGFLEMVGSRPGGLFANAVYLGAMAGGACAMAAIAWARGACPTVIGFTSVSYFTACVSLAGSRGAVIGLVTGIGAALVSANSRVRLSLAASTVIGWATAQLLSNINDGRDVAARVSLDDAGRSTVWKFAAQAIADRPLFGFGFGQFRASIQGRFDPEFVRSHARNPFEDAWRDAHNLVLQIGVLGGLVALAFLAAFAYSALRAARGPAAWAALAVAMTWMLQPVGLATGPMGMAWLGIAMAPPTLAGRREWASRTATLLITLGAVTSFGLMAVDQQVRRLLDRPNQLAALVEDLPSDPVLAATVASTQRAAGDLDVAVYWARRNTALEPFSAVASSALAELLLDVGEWDAADAEVRRALKEDPYNPLTLRTAFGISLVTENDALFDLVTERLAELDLD